MLALMMMVLMLVIFGPALKHLIAALGGVLWALLVGAVGIALLGMAISFPAVAGAIVVFLVIRGMLAR